MINSSVQSLLSPHVKFFYNVNEDKEQPSAYTGQPHYGYIREGIYYKKNWTLSWALNFWHEVAHIIIKMNTLLGNYLFCINSLAESLALESIRYTLAGNINEAKQLKHKADELIAKLNFLSRISKIANELSPTYYIFNKTGRNVIAEFIITFVIFQYLKNCKFSKDEIRNFVDKISRLIRNRMKSTKYRIRPEHESAYNCGEKIYRITKDLSTIDEIAFNCMNINFDYSYILEKDFSALKNHIMKNPLEYYPDFILQLALKNPKEFLAIQRKISLKEKWKQYEKNLYNITTSNILPKTIQREPLWHKIALNRIHQTEQQNPFFVTQRKNV